MKTSYYKKCLAVAVILLFIGVAFAPSINANVNTDNDLVEITTEFCGIKGVKPHTVKLTQQEAHELELLIDEIKSKLDEAETRAEVEKIFNEALEKLNTLRLIPKSLCIKKAYKLIFRNYDQQLNQETYQDSNYVCLVVGKITENVWIGYNEFIRNIINLFPSLPVRLVLFLLSIWAGVNGIMGVTPFRFDSWIALGCKRVVLTIPGGVREDYFPASGWVWTLGTNGLKEWNNSFYGAISVDYEVQWIRSTRHLCEGIRGFSGIKIGGPRYSKGKVGAFFLGSAINVSISDKYEFG